jgi:hypothetical protein
LDNNYLPNTAFATNENYLLQSYGDVEQLRRERGKLLATMSGLKRKVADIEQQEEELLREVQYSTVSVLLTFHSRIRLE